MTAEFVHELCLHLKAEYPLVFILSQEEKRAGECVKQAASELEWDIVAPRKRGKTSPVANLLKYKSAEGAIVVLDDVHRRIDEPDTLRALADLAERDEKGPRAAIIIAPWIDLPPELERLSAVLYLPLPAPDELVETLAQVCVELGVLFTDEDAATLVRAAQGLSEEEAIRAFKKAMIGWPEDALGALESVAEDKKRALRRSRVLETVVVPANLDDVGGLDRLKDWLTSRGEAFSSQAKEFGLPAPRGLLLMGVQGCGKSLTAKAVAGYWRLPLIRLDLSSVFGSDRPEEALRGALRVAEAMAPVVLWIDEIEKGFDQGGTGPAARLLGGMVTWLQEKQKEVFVVATANRVRDLPPELPRKGRFDEIFFVDLPNFHERIDILKLHLKKHGRNPDVFSLEALAKKADRFTGSELEQLIISAMYSAFSRKLELTDDDLLRALKETVPLYDTFEQEIKSLREWARRRARPASTDRRKIDLFAEST
ncbi:MAG: AAA family ATPase [Deltaproteobacteria bacterium]|nr:AAA family ATPase [Deltaproteobacteria bacterium]